MHTASKQTSKASKASGGLDSPRVVLSDLTDALFEAVPYGLVVTDQAGVIQWADRCFGDLVAKDPDQLRGLRLSRCLIGAGHVVRDLRGRKKVDELVRLRRKGAPEMQLHVQAVRGGPRASRRIVWAFDDNAIAPMTPPREPAAGPRPHVSSPGSRSDAPPMTEPHLEALRLLHELAAEEAPWED